MLRTHPFRSALAALFAAAALVALAGVTDEGRGSGWTDGTQAIANIAWILMVLLVVAAAVLLLMGIVQHLRGRRP